MSGETWPYQLREGQLWWCGLQMETIIGKGQRQELANTQAKYNESIPREQDGTAFQVEVT